MPRVPKPKPGQGVTTVTVEKRVHARLVQYAQRTESLSDAIERALSAADA